MTDAPLRPESLITLPLHLEADERLGASAAAGEGDLAGVLIAIARAGRSIAGKLHRARLLDVIGDVGGMNPPGEAQPKLDALSDQIVLEGMRRRFDVAVYASQGQDEPIVLRPRSAGGRFCVLVDPLDGSSNVDVAVSVGTIFSVLHNERPDDATADAVLQAGSRQVAAGYVLYGSSVVLVLTTGQGVDMYVLDPTLGEFLLVKEHMRVPERGKTYSINEAYWNEFPEPVRAYLGWAHDHGYASRYVGSMVADVHRILLKGGVFLYPASTRAPSGKLRLLYECNPIAMLVEQAGGTALAVGRERVLDVRPATLHDRSPLVVGSPAEVEEVARHLA